MGADAEPDKAACSHTAASLPSYYAGAMYTSHVAAAAAAFLNAAGIKHAYRKHRLVLDSPPRTELMDFWLPATNTFLFVYPDMPLVGQCRMHERVAQLGHNVAVLVGRVAAPVRRTPADPPNGWRGWTLEEFTARLLPGWTSWIHDAGAEGDVAVRLACLECPYDERCCAPELVQLYTCAAEQVSSKPAEPATDGVVESLRRTVGKLTLQPE